MIGCGQRRARLPAGRSVTAPGVALGRRRAPAADPDRAADRRAARRRRATPRAAPAIRTVRRRGGHRGCRRGSDRLLPTRRHRGNRQARPGRPAGRAVHSRPGRTGRVAGSGADRRAFASANGAMHACGHDVHLAALSALGRAARHAELPVALLAVLQPREEAAPSGALDIATSASFVAQQPAAVIGVHLQHAAARRDGVGIGRGHQRGDRRFRDNRYRPRRPRRVSSAGC